MKHNLKITILIVSLFFLAQVIGILVTQQYIVNEKLPLGIERPDFKEDTSYIPIIIAIFLGTIFALLLVKFKAMKLWKLWFLISIWFTLVIAFGAFLNEIAAFLLATVLALWKVLKPNVYVHNMTELFIYAGLAGIFVPILNLFSVSILLIVISVYDIIAVWKTKHMIKLAKFQTKSKLFAGLNLPYEKKKAAILGGGDIGLPLLFAGVILKNSGFLNAFIVIAAVTIALLALMLYGKKNKFYPAMPFLSFGCLIGYLITLLV